MIFQLPSGRTIELSLEHFLILNDHEIQDLNGIASAFTSDYNNPFQNLYSSSKVCLDDDDFSDEVYEILLAEEDFTPELFEITETEKLADEDFYRMDE